MAVQGCNCYSIRGCDVSYDWLTEYGGLLPPTSHELSHGLEKDFCKKIKITGPEEKKLTDKPFGGRTDMAKEKNLKLNQTIRRLCGSKRNRERGGGGGGGGGFRVKAPIGLY